MSNRTVMENILVPGLFSRNFYPYISSDPLPLDIFGCMLKNILKLNVAFKSYVVPE